MNKMIDLNECKINKALDKALAYYSSECFNINFNDTVFDISSVNDLHKEACKKRKYKLKFTR